SLLQRRNLAPLQTISSRPPSTEVDQCLKGYDILEVIGQGSAGKVYKAQRSSDRRKVALKVLEAPDEEMLQLRRGEFEVLKTVSHPNIVRAFDFFSSNSRAVLVLSYHSGQTLRKLVKHSGGLPEAVARRLFGKLASAVDYLHSRRIIHRDITENNVIISDDRIDLHLADFNAAKALTEGGALTLTGSMDFNPPEVLNGHSSSEKHDIWSLGLCLHLMLLGSLPHKRGAESKEALSLALTRSPVRCVGPRYGGISEPCKELLRRRRAQGAWPKEKEARPAAMILLQMASKELTGLLAIWWPVPARAAAPMWPRRRRSPQPEWSCGVRRESLSVTAPRLGRVDPGQQGVLDALRLRRVPQKTGVATRTAADFTVHLALLFPRGSGSGGISYKELVNDVIYGTSAGELLDRILQLGVAHRDLKLENFLLTEGDFEEETVLLKLVSRRNYVYGGFVRGFIGAGLRTAVGSVAYAAPEVVSGNYSSACDLWSCGVILMDEALESSLDPLRTASIFFEEIRENAISEAFLKIRQIISTYETLNRRYIEPHRYYVPAPETSEHLPSVELNSAERSFTLNELEDFDLNLEEDNHELLEEMSNDDERFWITSAPRRVSNHLSGILSVSRGQFLSTLVALSLELELVSPWALRLCSAVFRTSITSVLVLSVEGYDIQVDFDHGAQLSQEGSTQKESEGETQLETVSASLPYVQYAMEQYANHWQGNQLWQQQSAQWDPHGNSRPKTPRRKSRPRSAKGNKTPRGEQQVPQGPMMPNQQMIGMPMGYPGQMPPAAPLMNWGMQPMPMMQAPFPHSGSQPPLPPPPPGGQWSAPPQGTMQPMPPVQSMNSVMGAGFTMPVMPKAPTMPGQTEQVSPELMTMLKQDVAVLPPHIQKAVKESAIKEYAAQFAAQEQKLAEQITTTKEAFLEAKVSSAKAHEAAGQVQEISDEEFGDLTTSTSGSAQKITDAMVDLNKSLATLQEQAMAVPEEEVHLAKRCRIIDQWQNPIPPEMRQDTEQQEPDPDVIPEEVDFNVAFPDPYRGAPGEQPPFQPPDADPHDSESDASIHSADKSILVYRLHARDEHCFATWSTYMTILDGIIHALRLPRSQIRTFHRLAVLPPDIHEISEEAVILQSIHDVPAGSDEKLVLVDTIVHFHASASGLAVPAATSRQVMRVNAQLHRSHILILQHLDDYCQTLQDRCIVHKNHRLWEWRDNTLHVIAHGDYIRIQVPPPEDPELDTQTAIAIARGVLEATPSVCNSRSDQAHLSLMQNTVEVFSHLAQQIDVHNAIKELKTDPIDGDSPRFASRQNDRQEDRTGRRPTWPSPRADFAAGQLRRLSRLVDEADLVECEEEGRIAYITTWYLHHSEHKTCRDSRPVRLSDHQEWKAQIIEAWQDVVRLDQSLSLSLVSPQPPCSDLECTQAHVLIEQGQQPDHVGFVISVIDEARMDQRREQITHSAHSDEAMQTRGSIIHLARLQTLQPQGQCRVTWKQFPFAIHDPEILESATNVVIQLPRNGVSSRDEAFSLMQTELILQTASTTQDSSHQSDSQCAVDINHSAPPREAIAFQFNLNAAPFQPGQANLFGANEFVIDLFAQWNQHAAVWDEEMPSCTIETWFVDHRWQNPHCRNSRQKQLFANYWQWEDELRRLWIEYVDARSNIDFYLVHPKPPSGTNAVAAHVILVQQEREDWVTSLVSVYEARPDRPSLHYNIAVTTHEHILVDNLLRVVGHETHCLAPIPSHGFAAWYLQIQLQRGQPLAGRSGYAISLQIWQFRLADYLPHTAELLEAQHGPTLLQTKTQRRTICIEEALVDESEQDLKSDKGPSYAVRLRAGDLKVQVPPFLEIDDVPTESKIVDELKNWGHDCFVFQFAGHHEFLCLSRDRIHDDSVQHYIFGSTDGTDPNAAFLHSHKGEVLHELDCMKILHSLGYFKTTIQAIIQCLPDVYKVVFVPQVSILDPGSLHLRQPTPWPDRTPEELRTQPQPNFCCEDFPVECGPCKLSLGVDAATLASFFSQEEFPLCTTFEGLQLPPSTAMAPSFDWSTSCKMQDVERIVIYTDGSSMSHLRHQPPALSDEQGLSDTWAFVALGECYSDDQKIIRLIGWQAQPVHYDPNSKFFLGTDRIGSDASEKEALFWAALWRLSINLDIPAVFCSDSSISCGQASGSLSTNDYQQPFIMLRSAFQALEACLPGRRLDVRHVKGHSQDPWNDFVDYAAKAEREKSFYLPRPKTFDVRRWQHAMPHLWMIFAKDAGVPPFTQQGFDASAPTLPDRCSPYSLAPAAKVQDVGVTILLSLATVNVLSLSAGPEGHGGKVDYLRQQFRDTCLNILGIQEARSLQSFSTAGEVVRIASVAYKGHHGTELWISLRQPYAYVQGKPQFFHRRHFTVRHADPRTLLVSIDAPFLNALVLVGHGPQSGQPLSDREQWWQLCGELCTRQRVCDSQYLFALLDANAAAGVRDDIIVGPHEDAPSASTPMLSAFLEEQDLCLPATFSTHVGKHSTWTSPSGELQCRIDHVAIPQSLRSKCEFSIVDENFDLGLTHIDHELVGVQLHWKGCSQQRLQTEHQKQGFERADLSRLSLQTDMKDYKVPCWAHNIEQHVDHFNEFVITAMEKTHPSRNRGPKKPYLDEETWALRALKLRHRKALREIHRRQKIELLFQIWRAWTRQIEDQQQVDSIRRYSATLACCSVRCMAQLHNVAQQLKVRLCKAKARLLQSRLEQLPREASAGQILQAIHKIQGPTNPKKIKRRPFPLLKSDGTHCESSSQRSDRWAEFFCNMEGGRRLTHHELREGWIDNLQHFRQHQFDLSLETLPTLCDLERAYSHVRIGRAVGMDSIPPEACKYNAGQFARATFSQLLKMTLHGQEAIPHKGGRLTAAYKGKGDVDDCASTARYPCLPWHPSLAGIPETTKEVESFLLHHFP
ncbi:unnamed protein product, partial [Cladocopium goreaui]